MLGLYFTASWCGACTKFAPYLKDFYKRVNEHE